MTQLTFTFLTRPEVTPQLDRQMEELYQIAFQGEEAHHEPEEPQPESSGVEENSPLYWFVLGWVDAALVTQLALLTREIIVGGQKIRVAGVAGVGTHPNWRHRGFASALLHATESFIRKEIDVPFGLLVCAPEARLFYERAGWQHVADELFADRKGVPCSIQTVVMIFPFSQEPWPRGEINLCGSPW